MILLALINYCPVVSHSYHQNVCLFCYFYANLIRISMVLKPTWPKVYTLYIDTLLFQFSSLCCLFQGRTGLARNFGPKTDLKLTLCLVYSLLLLFMPRVGLIVIKGNRFQWNFLPLDTFHLCTNFKLILSKRLDSVWIL